MARVARSFWTAARFLPTDVRHDVAVLYAFCRAADDAADEVPSAALAREHLATMRREVLGALPPSPLIAAFHAVAARREIPLDGALMLLDGVASDIGTVRIATQDDLLRYCYRVASTVGVMMCRVIGCHDTNAVPFAVDLGLAMQLTNIVRDVAEDARRDRVYLPADLLAAHHVSPEDLRNGGVESTVLRAVTHAVLHLAGRYYRSAEHGMRFIPWRTRTSVFVAARLYAAIGRRTVRRGHDPMHGRMIVPRWEKVWWTLGAVGASVAAPWGDARAHDPALHHAIAGWPGANPGA